MGWLTPSVALIMTHGMHEVSIGEAVADFQASQVPQSMRTGLPAGARSDLVVFVAVANRITSEAKPPESTASRARHNSGGPRRRS